MAVDGSADQDGGGARTPRRIRFLGHATLLIDLGYVRILTDPLLRHRIAGLIWRHPRPRTELDHAVDAVLISHMHQDHLDVPSLRKLGGQVPLLVPPRAGGWLRRRGFRNVHELRAGQSVAVSESAATGEPSGIHSTLRPGEVRVRATIANHTGFRPPFGPLGGLPGVRGRGRRPDLLRGRHGPVPGDGGAWPDRRGAVAGRRLGADAGAGPHERAAGGRGAAADPPEDRDSDALGLVRADRDAFSPVAVLDPAAAGVPGARRAAGA